MLTIVVGDELAGKLAHNLNFPFVSVEERILNDGESRPKLEKEIKAEQVILLLQKQQKENVNSYLIKYLLLARKIKESGARIIGIMPYLPYTRQDKVFRPGEPLSALYIAELIEKNIDVFITCNMHEHRKKIGELFHIPAYNVFLFHEMAERFSDFSPSNTVVVGPDSESAAFVDDFCLSFSAQKLVLIKKRDVNSGVVSFALPPDLKKEDCSGKDFIIVDDIVSSGETILQTGEIVQELGAQTVSFAFAHAIFGDQSIKALEKVHPRKIVCSDTLENSLASVHISSSLAVFLQEYKLI